MRGLLLSLVLLCGCAHAVRPEPAESEEGDASYYGPGLYGHRTASGDVLRPGTLTAAHRTLPLGSCVRVTVLDSGRSVEVTVNSRCLGDGCPGAGNGGTGRGESQAHPVRDRRFLQG